MFSKYVLFKKNVYSNNNYNYNKNINFNKGCIYCDVNRAFISASKKLKGMFNCFLSLFLETCLLREKDNFIFKQKFAQFIFNIYSA